MRTLPELIRNKNAGDLLETFVISAVSSILAIRAFLDIFGYPQLGGAGFHIAHMLWGGLLLTAAVILALSYLGQKIRQLIAVIGGIGFGVFIDELGKFITADHNYFFQPTIALLYLIFLGIFFLIRFIEKHRAYSEKEYLMNSLVLFEEAVMTDMDKKEHQQLLLFLKEANKESKYRKITAPLVNIVQSLEIVPDPKPNRIILIKNKIESIIEKITTNTKFHKFIIICFIVSALFGVVDALYTIILSFLNPAGFAEMADLRYNTIIGILELLVQTGVTILTLLGAYYFKLSRIKGLTLFKYSLFVSILIGQFFAFYYDQVSAIFELFLKLFLLAIINTIISETKKRTNSKNYNKPEQHTKLLDLEPNL